MSTPTTEPSNRELATELYSLLGLDLMRRMKDQPSAEVLSVARAFMQDCHSFVAEEADRKILRRLFRLYLSKLLEGVQGANPKASLLAEVGHALRLLGVDKATASAGTTAALAAFDFSNLPFQ